MRGSRNRGGGEEEERNQNELEGEKGDKEGESKEGGVFRGLGGMKREVQRGRRGGKGRGKREGRYKCIAMSSVERVHSG